MTYQAVIRRVPFFSHLSSEAIDRLALGMKEVRVPARTILFREGEYSDKFYIVLEGRIAIIKGMDTPSEQILRSTTTGDFVGEMSLLDRDGLRSASAWVDVETSLLAMDRATFENLLKEEPTIAYDMLALLGRRLNESHEKAIHDLREKGKHLTEAYDELRRAQDQIIEKQVIERELLQAHKMQQSMLPVRLPPLAGYDIGATMIPARQIGGDFYDVIPLDEQRVGLAIGDVCGKGIPAAMYMSLVCNLLRAEAHFHASPAKVLQQVNHHLRLMYSRDIFVTVLYGVLHLARRTFHYARAGHEPPLLWNQGLQFRSLKMKPGQLLGLFDAPQFDQQRVQLHPGDTLLLYTDGVTEAQNERGQFLGLDGLVETIPTLAASSAAGALSAQQLCDQVVNVLHTHYGEVKKMDDITMLTLRVLS